MSWVQQNFRFLSLDTTLIESAIVGSSILYPVITDRLKTVTEYFSQIGKEEVHKKKHRVKYLGGAHLPLRIYLRYTEDLPSFTF